MFKTSSAAFSPAPHDSTAKIASEPPTVIGCKTCHVQQARYGKHATSACKCSNQQTTDMNKHEIDYAERLRAAFYEGSQQALVRREDAMGAAAEIEQLWAALWTMVGSTKDVSQMPDRTFPKMLGACPDERRDWNTGCGGEPTTD